MRYTLSLIAMLVMATIAFTACDAKDVAVDTPNVRAILNNAQIVYAGLPGYVDSGMVESFYYGAGSHLMRVSHFKTAYQQNGSFAFEYDVDDDPKSRYTYTRTTDSTVKTWWGYNNKLKVYHNLVKVINETDIVFPRKSAFIPGLLLKDFKGMPIFLNTLQRPVLVGTEVVNNVDCYKITALRLDSNTVNLWIAKKTSLILKLITDHTNGDKKSRVKSTWVIYPTTPQKVNEGLFVLRPDKITDPYAGWERRIIFSRFGALNALLLLLGLIYFIRKKAFGAQAS